MISREFLKSVELFARLGDEDASALAALAREDVFRKGDVIFREREAADRFYLVLAGLVEVAGSSPGGAVRLERGDLLGETALCDAGPRAATASAAVAPETHLAGWSRADFQRYLVERPAAGTEILRALLRRMGTRLRQTSDAVRLLLP